MSKRFVVNNKDIKKVDDIISVYGDEVNHINVLRHRVKDNIYINEYLIEITKINKECVEGKIVGSLEQRGEPAKDITLMQAYLKSDKMEYVVQKAVELGVKNIIPVLSKNCVVKLDEKDKAKKLDRLNKIAVEAIEQCGRTDEVRVNNVEDLAKIDFTKFDAVLVCHEASSNSLKEALNDIVDTTSIAVVVGPEGGLTETEVENILKNANSYVVSLGERVLRAETASFAALSILWYEFGDKDKK